MKHFILNISIIDVFMYDLQEWGISDSLGDSAPLYTHYLGIVIVSTIWLSVSRRSDTAGIPED